MVPAVVKTGTTLLQVMSESPPTPDSWTLLTAGTNDLAAGEHSNICKYLEWIVVNKFATTRIIVSIVPHCHDLPTDHPINRHTDQLNIFIKKLKTKYRRAALVDFNLIGHRLFNRHGMHVRIESKWLLAQLVIRVLAKVKNSSSHLPGVSKPFSCAASGHAAGLSSVARIDAVTPAVELITPQRSSNTQMP